MKKWIFKTYCLGLELCDFLQSRSPPLTNDSFRALIIQCDIANIGDSSCLVIFSALLHYHMIEIGIHPLLIHIILMLHHQHSMQKTLHICATLYAICISAWPSGRFMRGENLLQVLWGLQAPTHCGRPSSIFFSPCISINWNVHSVILIWE